MIVTDSQSACQALNNFSEGLDALRTRIGLYQQERSLSIQWVPGHCGIAGNELADKAAKEAASIPGTSGPISFEAICSDIRRVTKPKPPKNPTLRSVYRHISQAEDNSVESREDQTILAKVRSGTTTLFKEYANKIDDSVDATCPLCGASPHNLTHWMTECAGTLDARRRLLFEHGEEAMYELESLSKYPAEAVALIRATLLDHPGASP